MKRIVAMCLLTALCVTCLCSCDMGNGLVGELLEQLGYLDVDYAEPPIYVEPPVEGAEIDILYAEIPKLVTMGYTSIGLMYTDGSVKELMDAKDLVGWNGSLELEYQPGVSIYIKGFAAYNYSDAVSYDCNVPGSEAGIGGDFSMSDFAELYGPVECDYMHSLYVTVPLDSLATGYNFVELYANAMLVQIDGWVMFTGIDVSMAGELTWTDGIEPPIEPEVPTGEPDTTDEPGTTEEIIWEEITEVPAIEPQTTEATDWDFDELPTGAIGAE